MTVSNFDLPAVLSAHKLWLQGKPGGARADLSRADLSRADLYGANLSGADLSGANLYGANLSGANLYGANLYRADLSRADLSRADLYGADLSGANLSGANLSGADLSRANLYGANLSGADLSRANLSGANLYGANLYGANLYGANLYGAKNGGLAEAQTLITPEGDLVGWKKCKDGVIVELKIPKNAARSNATGRKCRAQFAEVTEVHGADVGISSHDGFTKYSKGETVKCDEWEPNRFIECAGGIHFFLTRIEAENY